MVKLWIEWVEEFFQGRPVYCRVTEETAIATQKFTAAQAKPGFEYATDEEALVDFMTVHWANKIYLSEKT